MGQDDGQGAEGDNVDDKVHIVEPQLGIELLF